MNAYSTPDDRSDDLPSVMSTRGGTALRSSDLLQPACALASPHPIDHTYPCSLEQRTVTDITKNSKGTSPRTVRAKLLDN